jgi:hypothetical protein
MGTYEPRRVQSNEWREVRMALWTLLEKGLTVRSLAVAHPSSGAPLLFSSGAPKTGAPLL